MKTLHTTYTVIATLLTISVNANSVDSSNSKQSLMIEIKEVKHPTCNGYANGKATVEVKGGQASYTFDWNTFPAQHSATAVNLKAGIYFVEVRDANNTISYRSVEIKEPFSVKPSGPNAVQVKSETEVETVSYTCVLEDVQMGTDKIADLSGGIYVLKIVTATGCVLEQIVQVFLAENNNEISHTEILPTGSEMISGEEITIIVQP